MSLPIGEPVRWTPPEPPAPGELSGRHVLLRPLRATDAEALFAASHPPRADAELWTYMAYGPFASPANFRELLASFAGSRDPLFYTLVPRALGQPAGVAAYLRIVPEHGVIEIGHIWLGDGLARTSAATEAIFLLGRHAFEELGYRRLEWKCDALNAASRRAALRFGFRFEGVFAHHMVVKGHNRDTAWFAITDREWPAIARGFQAWLAPDNLDAGGGQRRPLGVFIPAGGAGVSEADTGAQTPR
jgi:RimJ/RimL family protein N-acetyltransferase